MEENSEEYNIDVNAWYGTAGVTAGAMLILRGVALGSKSATARRGVPPLPKHQRQATMSQVGRNAAYVPPKRATQCGPDLPTSKEFGQTRMGEPASTDDTAFRFVGAGSAMRMEWGGDTVVLNEPKTLASGGSPLEADTLRDKVGALGATDWH